MSTGQIFVCYKLSSYALIWVRIKQYAAMVFNLSSNDLIENGPILYF